MAREPAYSALVVVTEGPSLPDLFGRRAVERLWLQQLFGRWHFLTYFGWEVWSDQLFEWSDEP